jgi:hypothetical protein
MGYYIKFRSNFKILRGLYWGILSPLVVHGLGIYEVVICFEIDVIMEFILLKWFVV